MLQDLQRYYDYKLLLGHAILVMLDQSQFQARWTTEDASCLIATNTQPIYTFSAFAEF